MIYFFKKKIMFLAASMPLLAAILMYLSPSRHLLTTTDMIVTALACLLFFFAPLLLRRWQKGGDEYLFPLVIFLCSVSMVMLLRLKPALYRAQFQWIAIGLVVMFLVINYADYLLRFLDYPYLLGLFSLLIIFSVLIFGTSIGGNKNWIVFGPFQVQPSEFAKLTILGFLASYLQENKNTLNLPSRSWSFLHLPPLRFLAPLVVIWGISLLMFVYQRDLGSALLFFGMALMMTYAATSNKTYVFLALGFFMLGSYISYLLFGHVRVRVDIWLHPWADPMGKAYQIVQSMFALGYGGLFGAGYFHGYPNLIPEVHTDFIFAAIGEEFGLFGVFAVVSAYLLIFFRGVRIAMYTANEKEKLLAFGLTGTLLLQAFIILAGVTRLIPLTGITLPFVSYGGSSMVSGFICLGLLLAISGKEKKHGR